MTEARYLLDTNMVSDLIRNPQGRVAQRIADLGEPRVGTSIIVACEQRFGALKKESSQLSERVDAVLERLITLPLEADADRHYAEIRWHLECMGQPIGPNDLLIASHAKSLGWIMVTANSGEFSRVPELAVENWLTG